MDAPSNRSAKPLCLSLAVRGVLDFLHLLPPPPPSPPACPVPYRGKRAPSAAPSSQDVTRILNLEQQQFRSPSGPAGPFSQVIHVILRKFYKEAQPDFTTNLEVQYSICCLRDVMLKIERDPTNSIQNISISGVKFSWTTLFCVVAVLSSLKNVGTSTPKR